nr:unnamed protein product [Callosobruchus chinensis]
MQLLKRSERLVIINMIASNTIGRRECRGCGKHYMTKSGLMKHMKYECGQDKRFQCIYCEHSTKQRYNLVVHVKHRHKDHLREFMQWYYEKKLHQWNAKCEHDERQ